MIYDESLSFNGMLEQIKLFLEQMKTLQWNRDLSF